MPKRAKQPQSDDSDSDNSVELRVRAQFYINAGRKVPKKQRDQAIAAASAATSTKQPKQRSKSTPGTLRTSSPQPIPGPSTPTEIIEISDEDDYTTAVPPSSQTTGWTSSQQPSSSQLSSSQATIIIDSSPPPMPKQRISVIEALERDKSAAPKRAATSRSKKRKSDTESSDETPKKRRKRTTAEEKEAEREEKRKQKEEERAQKKRSQEMEKAAKKAHREANFIMRDKKTARAKMIISVSPSLRHDSQFQQVLSALEPLYDGKPTTVNYAVPDHSSAAAPVVRWQRIVTAHYNATAREWYAVDEHKRFERTALLWVTIPQLSTVDLASEVARARTDKRDQIFVMLYGLSKIRNSAEKARLETLLVQAQIAQKFYLLEPVDAQDAARWILEMTGDLAVRPYKLIEKSYLNFCSSSVQPSKRSAQDSYEGMLLQIPRVTKGMIESITAQYPTLNSLLEGFERSGPGARNMLLGLDMRRTNDGRATSRHIGNVGSAKIANVFTSDDQLLVI